LISTTIFPVPPDERYGGIESLVYDFAHELAELKHEVTLAAPLGSKPPHGVELHETVNLQQQKGFGSAEERAYFHYAYRLGEFDVIHDFSHAKHAALRHPNLPIISVCWFEPEWFTEQNGGNIFPMPKSNVVALSKYQAEKYQKIYKQNALIYSTNCRDPLKYSLCTKKGSRFLFIGKMSWHKGAQQAINFCKNSGYDLDIVGGAGVGEPKFYRDNIFNQCDDKQIVWCGEVTEIVKIHLLQHARALLYPVQFPEAHNLVLIEALMCGTPVITFNRGAMKEVVGEMSFAAKDDEEFKNAMETAPSDPDDFRQISLMAHTQYSSRNVVYQYQSLYEHVAKGARWS